MVVLADIVEYLIVGGLIGHIGECLDLLRCSLSVYPIYRLSVGVLLPCSVEIALGALSVGVGREPASIEMTARHEVSTLEVLLPRSVASDTRVSLISPPGIERVDSISFSYERRTREAFLVDCFCLLGFYP